MTLVYRTFWIFFWLGSFMVATELWAAANCKPLAEAAWLSSRSLEEQSLIKLMDFADRLRPVPEFAPSRAVIVTSSALLTLTKHGRGNPARKMVEAILKQQSEVWISVLGKRGDATLRALQELGVIKSDELSRVKMIENSKATAIDEDYFWTRDFGPIFLKDKASEAVVMADLLYDMGGRKTSDAFPRILTQSESFPRMSLPLRLEGGNLMTDANGNAVMSRRVIDANPELAALGKEGDAAVSALIRRFFGAKDVTIIEPMPYEPTGHIDLFAKFLPGNKVAVNELSKASMEHLHKLPASVQGSVLEVREFLDRTAKLFAAKGYEVIRMPQPLPLFSTRAGPGKLLMRSYTNSLLLGGKAVLVPRYETLPDGEGSYPDAAARVANEAAVVQAYAAAGYPEANITFIYADSLIRHAGAIHCMTMQVPQ